MNNLYKKALSIARGHNHDQSQREKLRAGLTPPPEKGEQSDGCPPHAGTLQPARDILQYGHLFLSKLLSAATQRSECDLPRIAMADNHF